VLYMMVEPFQKKVKGINFWVYCKLIYENQIFWGLFYDLVCWMFPSKIFNQINYGYAPMNKDGKLIDLAPEYEGERMSLQLYYRTVTGFGTVTDLAGKTVLEISSGRAGGIEWISNTFPVKKIIGLDISENNISWCKTTYAQNPKLEFVLGNALNFVDSGVIKENSIDIIISVDSAHLYPDFDAFVEQCRKAIKPDGHFFMSDFMESSKLEASENYLKQCNMLLLKHEVTTQNIMHAMDLDGDRRNEIIISQSPRILTPFFKWNSGARGSRIYELLRSE
jgi:SAM-dependent methyltransferase